MILFLFCVQKIRLPWFLPDTVFIVVHDHLVSRESQFRMLNSLSYTILFLCCWIQVPGVCHHFHLWTLCFLLSAWVRSDTVLAAGDTVLAKEETPPLLL